MQQKTILIPTNLKLSLTYVNFVKFLAIENNLNCKYVTVPSNVMCSKKENFLSLTNISLKKEQLSDFNQFITRIEIAIKNINKIFKRKLTLKGLGFRITVLDNKIEFKIGFSHLICLVIPQNIKIRVNKNLLFLESNDIVLLGNFVNKVITLKAPDSYKGKGFWSKYQEKTLKAVKKK